MPSVTHCRIIVLRNKKMMGNMTCYITDGKNRLKMQYVVVIIIACSLT